MKDIVNLRKLTKILDGAKFRVVWAIIDQAILSLTNFGLNFALARYATSEVYGVFTVAFTLLLVARSSIQSPFTLDPLINVGGKKTKQKQHIYVRRILVLNILISFFGLLILLAVAFSFQGVNDGIYAKAALLSALPFAFVNLRFFVRNFYIMRGRFDKASLNDFVVLIVVVMGLVGLVFFETVNEWHIFVLLTIGEIVALLVFFVKNYQSVFGAVVSIFEDLKKSVLFWKWSEIHQNWHYGKWLLLARAAREGYQNAQFILLPLFLPLSSLAGYRAIYLLAQPIFLFTTGLEAFIWGQGARRMRERGMLGLERFMLNIVFVVTLINLLYMLIVGFGATFFTKVVYAGKFVEYSNLGWFFLLAALFGFWGKVLGGGFRIIGNTNAIFKSVFVTGILGLLSFAILTRYLGVTGTAISYTSSTLISVIVMSVYWSKRSALVKNATIG